MCKRSKFAFWPAWTCIALAAAVVAAPHENSARAAGEASPSGGEMTGVTFVTHRGQLIAIGVHGSYARMGLRAGDQIVAVNGLRVSTEAAFWKLLQIHGAAAVESRITIARHGTLRTLEAPLVVTQPRIAATTSRVAVARGRLAGGFMNPSLMVLTSQGVMHRDAAARLGLEGTPIEGAPEWPDEE